MHPCPISLEHLYLLLGAFEGMSLWGVLDKLPATLKSKVFFQSYCLKKEFPASRQMNDLFDSLVLLFKIYLLYSFFVWVARALKWMPSFVIAVALVFYAAYPVFMKQSASVVFYNHWQLICGAIAGCALLQLGLLFATWCYFLSFERRYNSVVDFGGAGPNPSDFDVV